jgi:hypothetical protein
MHSEEVAAEARLPIRRARMSAHQVADHEAHESVLPGSFVGVSGAQPLPPGMLLGLQRVAGNRAVQRMVRLADPPNPTRILDSAQRRAFVGRVFTAPRDRTRARQVIQDMGATSDTLDFSSPDELRAELTKRVTMARVMQESQVGGGGLAPFGYPFTGASLYWGPRVNFDAKDYWIPGTPDNYDMRRDPAKRADLRAKRRGERHVVFGDQPGLYQFNLSPLGAADPYEAIIRLFRPQPAHKRSLIHCDYLVSLVHFRAFMATLGKPAFNSRIAAYGPGNIQLRWNLFTELEPSVLVSSSSTRPGLGSIRAVATISTPADLVIGDHVYFLNHPAYDLINHVGNAWRLENAVLVSREGGTDRFLGHGSGLKTAGQMQAKLAEEYNDVVRQVIRLAQRTARGSASARATARAELSANYPSVTKVGTAWRVVGTNSDFGVPVDIPLAQLRASQIPGLRNPADPTHLYPVRRPVESA